MLIQNSTPDDLATILSLYHSATEYQKTVFTKYWQPFDRQMIEQEIAEKRQWKMVIDQKIVCIFAITYNDPIIWKEKDSDPSIYLHRIVTHPDHRGNFFVKDIIAWALNFGRAHGKQFIRMDTFGDNQKLIDYYVACGFTFLGLTTLGAADDLPKHYKNASLSLFEIPIGKG
jgi:ribosomal protein S18 acetylase RimI-like enzyme